VERRGWVTHGVCWVNGRPEEPSCLTGRRQPSLSGTSRMRRESHVRICERLGVKFPGPTRRRESDIGFCAELQEPAPDGKGEAQAAKTARREYRCRGLGRIDP